MSIDGFLTLLSLVIAVYALLPRYRQLEIRLTWTIFDWFLLIPATLVILYLHFFEVFAHLGWTPGFGLKERGLSTDRAAYVVAGVVTLYFLWRLKRRKLNRSSIFKFRELVDELISSQAWAELFALIKKRLSEVFILYKADVIWTKLRIALRPHGNNPMGHLSHSEILSILARSERGEEVTIPKASWKQKVYGIFSRIQTPIYFLVDKVTPNFSDAQVCAKDVIQELLLSKRVNEALVEFNPYLGLEFVKYHFYENIDFVEIYLKLQIRNTKSALFKEIQRNLNSSAKNRYNFPDRNRILITLVMDVKNAVKYQVWRPVAEGALEFLDDLHASGNDEYAREPFNYEELKKNCPIQVSLWFFDIMISEAFFQKEQWHMWLYYMTHYMRKILNNIPDHSTSDSKYQTRYHHLIEDIVWRLGNWIELIEDAEPAQENATLDRVNASHENGNIPKSAILCLGAVLEEIIDSEKLTPEFKHEFLHHALLLYYRLKFKFKKPDYATVLLLSLRSGGSDLANSNKISQIQNEYILAWNTFDKVPYFGYDDYDKEILSVLLGSTNN